MSEGEEAEFVLRRVLSNSPLDKVSLGQDDEDSRCLLSLYSKLSKRLDMLDEHLLPDECSYCYSFPIREVEILVD